MFWVDENTRLNPLADVVFSCIFKDMQGAQAMKELINAVLVSAGDEPISEIIEMRSQYAQISKRPNGKSGRLDVKAKTNKNQLVNMEINLAYDRYFVDREDFYACTLKVENVNAGETYQNMPEIKIISLLDFVLRKNSPDIVQPIKLMYTKNPIEQASKKVAYYNVELPKFRERYNSLGQSEREGFKRDPLNAWLYMLTQGYKSKEEMTMLRKQTIGLADFSKLYTAAIADQDLRDMYEYEMSCVLDDNSRMQAARDDGRAEGRAEGIAEGIAQGVANSLKNLMNSMHMSLTQAMDVLCIPQEKRSLYSAII